MEGEGRGAHKRCHWWSLLCQKNAEYSCDEIAAAYTGMIAPENSLHKGHFVFLYILSLSEASDWFSSGRKLLSLSCL